jgi:hypothetical protein
MLGLDIDAQGRIYVGSFQNSEVLVFAAGSTGNVAPIGVLRNSVSDPSSIAFEAQQNVYVANEDIGTITIYAANSFGPRIAPIRTIQGGLTFQPLAITITADQRLFALNFVAGIKEVWEYQPGANGNAPFALLVSSVNPALLFVNNIIAPFRQ